ncbi:MAG: Hsp70 family protein [Candidatus Omnitrophica bacterium]|nr:Hsp70 family protein [Candidatus Omnitrophota bacterium]
MGRAIGIDLGTTNSVACIKVEDVKILQNAQSENATMSCVGSYKIGGNKREILVGSLAIEKMKADAENTIISIKRLMGRAYSDKEIAIVKGKVNYEIVSPKLGTEESLCVVMGAKEYSPTDISAMILKKIKDDAPPRLNNDEVDRAVITVPAYFNEKQKAATREAGWQAGFKVQKIVAEPTAAAIAYGIDHIGPDESKTILVYDMGGGTFDVSILTVAGGVFAELGKSGDMWLGGDDFDHMIMDYILDYVKDEYGVDVEKLEKNRKVRFKVALKTAAEKAKKVLSSSKNTTVTLYGELVDSDNNMIDIDVELTRGQFEQMIQDKIKRSAEITKRAISNAHLTIENIDEVIMVGGSTMIPMVKRALIDIFGEKKVLTTLDQMNCVAQGAAILAQRLSNEIECLNAECGAMNPVDREECLQCGTKLDYNSGGVYETTPNDYGILTVGDKFDVIIPKGSAYPSPEPVVKSFFTPRDNMRRVKIAVLINNENESELKHQTTAWLPLSRGIPRDTRIDVTMDLDGDGILNSIRVNLMDGSGKEIIIEPDRGDKEGSGVEKMLDDLKKEWDQKQVNADPKQREEAEKVYNEAIDAMNAKKIDTAKKKAEEFKGKVDKAGPVISDEPQWKQTAGNYVNYVEFVVTEYGSYLDPQKTYKLKKLVEELKTAMAANDQKVCEQKVSELDAETKDLPQIVQYFLTANFAVVRAQNNGDNVRADRVQSLLRELRSALDNNAGQERIEGISKEINQLVNDIYGDDAKPDVRAGTELPAGKVGQFSSSS